MTINNLWKLSNKDIPKAYITLKNRYSINIRYLVDNIKNVNQIWEKLKLRYKPQGSGLYTELT